MLEKYTYEIEHNLPVHSFFNRAFVLVTILLTQSHGAEVSKESPTIP